MSLQHLLDLLTEADGEYHDGLHANVSAVHDGESAFVTLDYLGAEDEVVRTETYMVTAERA